MLILVEYLYPLNITRIAEELGLEKELVPEAIRRTSARMS